MKKHFAEEHLSPSIIALLVFLTAGSFFSPVLTANTLPAANSARSEIQTPNITFETFLRDTVTRYHIPSLSVAVVDRNGVAYAAGFGSFPDGKPVTENTPFILGSTTKTFTALATLRLVDEGKLNLDAPVTEYLPEFSVAVPGAADKITVRHLLHHTSGLSDKGSPFVTTGTGSLATEIALMKRCVPDRAPGLTYSYFNGNYRILGAIIERVSGTTYEEYLQSVIFKPLLMGVSTGTPETVKGIAEGHGSLFGYPIRQKQIYRQGALPSGYLTSSASDIARFLIDELCAGSTVGDTASGAILYPDLVRLSWASPVNLPNSYAMGWLPVRLDSGKRILCHGGSLEGYQSFFYLDPEAGKGFVFMMNQGGLFAMTGAVNTIRDGLISILSDEKPLPGPGLLPVRIVTFAIFAVLAFEIFLTFRLFKRKTKKRSIARNAAEIIWGIIIAGIPIYLVPLMNKLTGERATWQIIWAMVPEFCIAVFLIASFSFIRIVYKLINCALMRSNS